MEKRFEITEMAGNDDGFLIFGLAPSPDHAALLPRRVIEDIKESAGDEWVQARFSAALDCRTMGLAFVGAIIDRDDREIKDYEIGLPEQDRRELFSAIDEWCAKNLSQDVVAAADDHLVRCGMKAGIGDHMARMRNIDFSGAQIHAARATGNDTDYFGNALAVSFSPKLPAFLEGLSATLKDSGLTGMVEINLPYDAFRIEPMDCDADFGGVFARMPKEEFDELTEGSGEVGRYYSTVFISPQSAELVAQFRAKDCDEMVADYLPVSKMKKLAQEKPQAGVKPKM